jgi:hypothetical protein
MWRLSGFFLALSLFAATPVLAQDADVVGNYRMTGLADGQPYEGQVSVERSGDTYLVNWNIGGSKHVGTGLLNGRIFSTIFVDPRGIAGIAVYQLRGGGEWDGTYTVLGATTVGTEQWTPMGAP